MKKTNAIVWLARILSIPLVGLVLVFAVGEGFNPTHLAPRELLAFLFFPFGVCVGMGVAWWREGLGGLTTVASLAAFYAAHFATSGRFPGGPWFLITAAPGFLFLAGWLYGRSRRGP